MGVNSVAFERRVAILQSNYLPWSGYFELIADVDLFIFYDEVQYTKSDWRNRNRFSSSTGVHWLTIPVSRDSTHLKVSEVLLPENDWREEHVQKLSHYYQKAPFRGVLDSVVFPELKEVRHTHLSRLNQRLIVRLSRKLGIRTEFVNSAQFALVPGKVDRLLGLLQQVGATHYVTGPLGMDYLNGQEERFGRLGIELQVMKYSSIPPYRQGHCDGDFRAFDPQVSLVDSLCWLGLDQVRERFRGANSFQSSLSYGA